MAKIGFTFCRGCREEYFTADGHRCSVTSPTVTVSRKRVVEYDLDVPDPLLSTYKYRDPEKHRAYMAEYMRAYRKRKKTDGGV